MPQGERIKELRKSLSLTLEKFGEKLGVTKTAISRIEKGERNLTEQMAKAICREFSVDYIWLTTGEGEMFVESDDSFLKEIDRIMKDETDDRKALFKALLYAPDEDIATISRMINSCMRFKNENTAPQNITAAEAAYEKSLRNAPSAESSALNTTGGADGQNADTGT